MEKVPGVENALFDIPAYLLIGHLEILWRNVAGARDVVAHHYFDMNAETA